MRTVTSLFASLLLLAHYQIALAQTSECPACRSMFRYGHCSKAAIANPPNGAIAFTGVVRAMRTIKCGFQIRVNVSHSSNASLPSEFEIAVMYCGYWDGKIGDAINATVFEKPSPEGVYRGHSC